MKRRYALAALRKQRGFSLPELSAECRKRKGGEGMGPEQVSAYLNGARPIGDVHFGILCEVLRVKPENVYTSRYLAGGRQEPIEAEPVTES
jgi:hypothetical protein